MLIKEDNREYLRKKNEGLSTDAIFRGKGTGRLFIRLTDTTEQWGIKRLHYLGR